jgi:hypothetical protein
MKDTKLISDTIKNNIIDYILASPLNVDMITDDIEREIYDSILETINVCYATELMIVVKIKSAYAWLKNKMATMKPCCT